MTHIGGMKKRVIIVFVILAIAGILFIIWNQREKDDGTVRTVGVVEGIEVNLASKIQGRISEICCKEGETIREGQVAVRLESSDLEASMEQASAGVERARAESLNSEAGIENAKANIKSAEAEIKSAEADLEKARVQMEEAKRDMGRAADLFKKDFISKSSYDQAVSLYDTTVAAQKAFEAKLKAAYARKNASVAQLNASLSQLSASMAQQKEAEAGLAFSGSKLADTTIYSPISGTVVYRSLEKGETVNPGSVILTIVELDNLFVRVDIEETLVSSVVLGSDATIVLESMPGRVFKGKVSEIGRYAEFATQRDVTRGRQDIKTFRVKIKVEDKEGILKPGMTVSVGIPKKK
jgi:HlyD family secretion protein